jgi:hypothetical protein
MDRRRFLASLAASMLTLRYAKGQTPGSPITLGFGIRQQAAVPLDFTGLSYESAQLANPDFFSPRNRQLVALFRELSPSGNLRLGGGSSEFTTFSADTRPTAPPFEVFGPDTSKTVKTGTTTTALAIRNLREFLDATGWSCLYGLNLGNGSAENAAREAAAVHRILGPRLLAFQIGNEPDSFRNRYRPATYGPSDFLAEWNHFHDAIVRTTPGARFAGPDISNKLAYLTAFAEEATHHPDVILLTSHYYAMGPAGSPRATLDNLLSVDPVSSTLKNRDLHVIEDACRVARLPYRMSEGSSCWNGGQTGVSDVYASALWCADYILKCMTRGWAGVNLHGGGDGIYTPIAGAPSRGFTRRPEYFGIRFAQRFAGAAVIETTITNASDRVDVFAFERHGVQELVIVNKTAEDVSCALPAGLTASRRSTLHAPAIDATSVDPRDGVQITESKSEFTSIAAAAPYTANVYALRQSPRTSFTGRKR